MSGIFITGTDTGVGKTVIAAGLAGVLKKKGYNAGIMKPVQSGAGFQNGRLCSPDIEFIQEVVEVNDEMELICPYLLKEAAAPVIAAKIEGKTINIGIIRDAFQELEKRHDIVIAEGAGGIAVPLKKGLLVSHMIRYMDIPAIIVARAGLGTINHTFLTVEYAKRSNIKIIGIIINDHRGGFVEETNPDIITDLTGIPILGIVPHDPEICSKGVPGNIVSLIEKNVNADPIINLIR